MAFERAKAAVAGTRFADLRWVESTGSTNTDVADIVRSFGLSSGGPAVPDIALVADHQTAGRGRLGRSWEAPPGASLLMTVGFAADPRHERRPLALTALGVAAVDACADIAEVSVGLKWPNDLVAVGVGSDGTDRKVAGILAEVHPVPGLGDVELIGIGINVNWPEVPSELAEVAVALNQIRGAEVDRELLAAAVLTRFGENLTSMSTESGMTDLTVRYRERSATIGRRVRVELPQGEIVGTASDVLPDGALVVLDDAGVSHTVTVGDVVHLRPLP